MSSTDHSSDMDGTIRANTSANNSTDNGDVQLPTTPAGGDDVVAAAAVATQQSGTQQSSLDSTAIGAEDGQVATINDNNPEKTDDNVHKSTDQSQVEAPSATTTEKVQPPANPETIAAQLEQTLKTSRREWRKLINECKQAMKSYEGEETSASLYYQCDDMYKTLVADTTKYTTMEGAQEAEKERRLEDLTKLPEEFNKFDEMYKAYRQKIVEAKEANAQLMKDLKSTERKNSKHGSGKKSSRKTRLSQRSEAILQKKRELEALKSDAEQRKIQDEMAEFQRQKEIEFEAQKKKLQDEMAEFERKKKAQLEQLERDKAIKQKEIELLEIQSSRSGSTIASSYTSSVSTNQKKSVVENKTKSKSKSLPPILEGLVDVPQDKQNKGLPNNSDSSKAPVLNPEAPLWTSPMNPSQIQTPHPLWQQSKKPTDPQNSNQNQIVQPLWQQPKKNTDQHVIDLRDSSTSEKTSSMDQHSHQKHSDVASISSNEKTASGAVFGPTGAYLLGKMLSEVGSEHKFSGLDLTKYVSFRNTMTRLADEYPEYPGMLLQVLMCRCEKGAQDAISFCSNITPASKAFQAAMKRLDLFYGNKMDLIDAHMSQICRSDKVSYSVSGFQKFLTELQNFSVVLLNDETYGTKVSMSTIKKVVNRLPYESREVMARDLQRCGRQLPTFDELLSFVEMELRHAANPLIRKKESVEKSKSWPGGGAHHNNKKNHGNSSRDSLHVNTINQSTEDTNKKKQWKCVVCNSEGKPHEAYKCPAFLSASVEQRRHIALEKKLCYVCLRSGHRRGSNRCRIKGECSTCGSKNHNTLLCTGKKNGGDGNKQRSHRDGNQNEVRSNSAICCTLTNSGKEEASVTYLPVIPILVKLPHKKKWIKANALIDCGCNGTLCLDSLAKKMECSIDNRYKVWINHACGSQLTNAVRIDALEAKGVGEDCSDTYLIKNVDSLPELPKHGNPIGGSLTRINSYPHLKNIQLPVLEHSNVDIIIGTNNEHLLITQQRFYPDDGNGPAAWRTPLGWTLVGSEKSKKEKPRELSCSFAFRRLYNTEVLEDVSTQQIKHSDNTCSGNPDTCKLLHEEIERVMYGDFEQDPEEEEEAPSKEDVAAMKMMESGLEHQDGHWTVPLPLRDKAVDLPDNRTYAVKRLMSLKNVLLKKPELLEFYTSKMKDLKTNYLEEVGTDETDGAAVDRRLDVIWYLVHFCTQQSKPRVVYDGPAQYKGFSLNGCLFQGGDNMKQLTDVLIRFREDSIAFVCDIKEMFLQVGIPVQQRDLLRVLWFKDDDLNGGITTYRFKFLPYGLICSMSMAAFVLAQIAKLNRTNADEDTVKMLRDNFYVDDGLGCAKDTTTAIRMAKQLVELLGDGGFKLRKFISNSKPLMEELGEDLLAPEVQDVDLSKECIPEHNVLGVSWEPNADRFVVKIKVNPKPLTKRGCWSMISNSVYDPIGICQPYLLTGRQILQAVCEEVSGWDDPLPSKLCKQWKKWYDSLHNLEKLNIRRCYTTRGIADSYQIHTFMDASTVGLGAASYLRCYFKEDNSVEVAFIVGKSRIVPRSNTTSVPKLELKAAILGSKLHRKVKNAIGLDIEKSYLWTDSTSVRNWICNRSSRFSKYIARNVAAIEMRTNGDEFLHVPTAQNPADIASRGVSPEKASSDTIWITGPAFLQLGEDEWPRLSKPQVDEETEEKRLSDADISSLVVSLVQETSRAVTSHVVERREVDLDPLVCCVAHRDEVGSSIEIRPEGKFSSSPEESFAIIPPVLCKIVMESSVWHRLLIRLVVRKRWVVDKILKMTCIDNLKIPMTVQKHDDGSSFTQQVSREEMEEATLVAIKVAQQEFFGSDFLQAVQKDGLGKFMQKAKGEDLQKAKMIVNLLPYIDERSVLRVGGRLHRSNLPQETVHPPILPKRHAVTKLIIEDTHQMFQHAGQQWVLSQVMRRYWILHGHCTVKFYLQDCLFCKERKARVGEQLMAPLPQCRVSQPHYPFEHTGVDYWGPFWVLVKRSQVKRWGAIFTCMATRACHLELVQDLTTSAFIQTYIRFINRRGGCTKFMYSDNGTNFHGADEEFKELCQKINIDEEDMTPFGVMDPELSYALEHNIDFEKIGSALSRKRIDIQWKFNCPRSSHQGGVWERLIRIVRQVMCSIVQKGMVGIPALQARTPTDFEMSTILTEIECILNNRPLTKVSDNPEDIRCLTPQNILTGVLHPSSPAGCLNGASQYRLNWKYTQIVAQQFWFLWKRMYIPWLQVRHKWFKKNNNLKVGDIVLVLDADKDLRDWYPKAVVTEVFTDKFGQTRNVSCRLADGKEYKRSVQKLVPLEINTDGNNNTGDQH